MNEWLDLIREDPGDFIRASFTAAVLIAALLALTLVCWASQAPPG
jgi:hypothetical protein